MALTATEYAELSNVKEELGITGSTDDNYLERLIKVASRRVDHWCHRTFHYEAAATLNFAYRKWPWVDLVKPNVIAITSVTDTETSEALVATGYALARDQLYLKVSLPNTAWTDGGIDEQIDYESAFPRHRVVYEAGYETPEQSATGADPLPIDIQFAVEGMVVDYFMNKGQNPRIKREHVLESAVWFDVNFREALMESVLAPYRRIIQG